jgi:hypothetical protein
VSDSDNEKRPRSSLAIWLSAVVVLSPILYLLSVGPAYWLMRQGYVSNAVDWIYAPIGLLGYFFPPFQDAMDWYADLEMWR